MKAKLLLLLLLCMSSLCVMGQGTVTRDKCKDCGKAISQCQYKGKHPKCPDCGKLLEKCAYQGKHPRCKDCGKLLERCTYQGKHPRCKDCGKLLEKCTYQGKHPRCAECGELLEKCKYGGKHPAPTPTEYDVRFYCNVPAAIVYVDGKNMGTADSSKKLKVGSHSIRITADGYEPYTGVFEVNAKNTTLTVSLKKIPPVPTTGTLKVTTTPSGATLVVDGKSVGTTPCEIPDLNEGQHSIRIALSGYSDEQRNVIVPAGKTSTLTVVMQDVEQKPTPEVVKPVSGTTPVPKPERTGYFRKNSFYASPEFQFLNTTAIGASLGGYTENINLEAYYYHGLALSDDIWWVPYPGTYNNSSHRYALEFSSFGGKLGYGIILGSRIRLTPQADINIVSASSKSLSGYSTSLGLGCKLDFALTKHFGIGIAPEYIMRIRESEVYSKLLSISSDFDKWSSGFKCRIGISVFF